jgi:hypothetical protein
MDAIEPAIDTINVNGATYYLPANEAEVIFLVNTAKTDGKIICMRGAAHSFPLIKTLEGFAEILHPKIRGWVNYYTRFYRQETPQVFCYLNELIRKWLKNKYKLTNNELLVTKYKMIQKGTPVLFHH